MASSLLRVHLIDDAQRNFYHIPVSDAKLMDGKFGWNDMEPPLEQHEKNMCKERKLFVIAALQLLESHEREAYDSVVAPAELVENPGFDIILSGFLKKGTKPSMTMGMSSGKAYAGGYVWKSKYVELKHKEFIYFDDDTEDEPLMVSSQHSYHPSLASAQQLKQAQWQSHNSAQASTKKIIILNTENCACRIISLDLGDDADCCEGGQEDGAASRTAFEICVLGGQRRVFRAGSAAECARWVEAINTAMAGRGVSLAGVVGPPAHAKNGSEATSYQRSRHSDAEKSAPSGVKTGIDTTAAPLVPLGWGRGDEGAREGGAGPFAQSIAQYLAWQQHLHSIDTEDAFRAAVRSLADGAVTLTVPVAYIRGKNADGHFSTPRRTVVASPSKGSEARAKGRSFFAGNTWLGSAKKPAIRPDRAERVPGAVAVSVEKTQMWKDLQRDEVCVNGERVCGTSGFRLSPAPGSAASGSGLSPASPAAEGGGAEAIVGLLARHIADAAAAARQSFLDREPGAAGGRGRVVAIRESQVVQCARNVLMLCNRTQSGGDTYYCVDGLLNRARGEVQSAEGPVNFNSGLFILAPVSTKAEPLEIAVDVVETHRNLFFPSTPHATGDSHVKLNAAAFEGSPFDRSRRSPANKERETLPESPGMMGNGGGGGEDCIEALVASSAAASDASPPARLPRRRSSSFSGRHSSDHPVEASRPDCDEMDGQHASAPARDEGAPLKRSLSHSRSSRLSVGVGGSSGLSPRIGGSVASAATNAGRGHFHRTNSMRSPKKASSVHPQDALRGDAATASTGSAPLSREGSAEMVANPGSTRLDAAMSQHQPQSEKQQSRRGSGRRSQLKLELRLDDEGTNIDAHRPSAAVPAKPALGAPAAAPIPANNSLAMFLDTAGDARDSDSVPVSVVCLEDGEEESPVEATPPGSSSALSHCEPRAVSTFSTRDDTTVISDITFDTTAAFSQSTVLASYQASNAQNEGGGVHSTPSASAASGKGSVRARGKALMKMLSSRLTPKPQPPGGPVALDDDDGSGSGGTPSASAPTATQGTTGMTTPRVRGAGATTFLSVDRDRPRHIGSYLGKLGTGRRRPSAAATAQTSHHKANRGYRSSPDRPEALCLCVRMRVKGVSRYRVCSADPQGDPAEDNWATVSGTFEQTFLVPACATAHSAAQSDSGDDTAPVVRGFERCRLALTERVVTISAQRFVQEEAGTSTL